MLTLISKWLINVSLSLDINVIVIWQSANFYLKNYNFVQTIYHLDPGFLLTKLQYWSNIEKYSSIYYWYYTKFPNKLDVVPHLFFIHTNISTIQLV